MMIRRCATACLVVLGCCVPQPPRAEHHPVKELELRNDNRIHDWIRGLRGDVAAQMARQGVPGLAIALVDREGIVWAEGFGTTEAGGGAAVDTRTMFSVQSISKTLTATGALAAVRDGILELDSPITTYVPDFSVRSRLEENPERRMTLRHLLSHHAGFTHEAPVGNNFDPTFSSFDQYIESISGTWLRYRVGERFSYANLGVDLAGYALQVVSGQPFWTFMDARLLTPLGMGRSSFDWAEIRQANNRAAGHVAGYKRVPLTFGLIPSGGFYSSAEDMAEFVRLHLNRGRVGTRQLVPQRLLDEMYAIAFPIEGQTRGYGLGLSIQREYGHRFFGHDGSGFGFQSHMSWYPAFGIGLVVLANADGHGLTQALSVRVVEQILRIELDDIPAHTIEPVKAQPIALARSDKQSLAGRYLGRNMKIDLAMRGDTLGGDGEQFLPLHFTSRDNAYLDLDGRRISLRFVRDSHARPSYLVVDDSGQTADYNDGPNDPPGPDKAEWSRHEGSYRYSIWSQRTGTLRVHRKNGYLYLDDLRLSEYRPGLFFSRTGEALDLRGETPTWRNIKLHRQAAPARNDR